MPPPLVIPDGSRYGSWIIQEEIGPDRRGNRQFLCKCTCGNKVVVLLMNLRRGTSLGCMDCCSSRGKKGRPSMSFLERQARQAVRNYKAKMLKDAGII